MSGKSFKVIRMVAAGKPPAPPNPVVNSPHTVSPAPIPTGQGFANSTVTLYADGARPGTFKEWRIYAIGNTVTTVWGPKGGTMQRNSKSYTSDSAARMKMLDTIAMKKRTKGYRDKP
jgi:predicted DNA-binding WGR domain protein